MARVRRWCGEAQFPGKEKFLLGTVEAETELEAERRLFELWGTLIPYDPPRTFTIVPGMLIFQGEDR